AIVSYQWFVRRPGIPLEYDKKRGKYEEGTPNFVEREIRRVEKEIANESVEHLVAFDLKGQIIFRTKGTEAGVKISSVEERLLRGAICTHNHPGQTWGFSLNDIRFASMLNLKEIRVVAGKHLFIMRPYGEARFEKEFFEKRVVPLFKKNRNRLRRALYEGKISLETFNKKSHHIIWLKVARELGFVYFRRTLK
ncbi:hypothetical protein J7M23_09650, partial [Candidatus Sumerlaeota bacterium]|nr:hypothetical protein [Candidatus Sumerlaeota bacterium]